MAASVRHDDTGAEARQGTGTDLAAVMQELATYRAASAKFNEWVAGAQALALLRGALTSGIFDAARTPSTATEIAEHTGVEEERVADICTALYAHGVFDRAGGRYRLSHDFATLAAPHVLQTLPNLIDVRMVEARALEAASAPDRPYTTLPPEDLLAVGYGVTAVSSSPLYLALLPAWFAEHAPELHARLETGVRHGEFGCGVGGGLLGMLLMYPRITAVGYEINAHVIAETRRRAEELGVADRVELRHADVRDVDVEAEYDTAFWSQGFFPAESQPAAKAAILKAMKPGAYLIAPGFMGGEPPATDDGLHEPQGQAYTRSKLVYKRWGIPALTAEELRAGMEAAGFEFVRFMPFGIWQYLLLRRPTA